MARVESVRLVDDLDGSPADETVAFAVDGKTFEIELSADNAARLRAALAEFVAAARRSSSSAPARRAGGSRSSSAEREHNQRVREWARSQGIEIGDRGRIPADVLVRYAEAQPHAA